MPPKRFFCKINNRTSQSPSGKRTRFSSSKLVSVGALPLRVPAHKKARIATVPDSIAQAATVLPQAAENNVDNAVPNPTMQPRKRNAVAAAAPARIVSFRRMLNQLGPNRTEEQITHAVSQFKPHYHKRNRTRKSNSKSEVFDSIRSRLAARVTLSRQQHQNELHSKSTVQV